MALYPAPLGAGGLPGEMSVPPDDLRHFTYRSSDGLPLHAAIYGDRHSDALPAVCLPGLTRNARDFHFLALRLAGDPEHPRRVVAFDYRGRGRSAYDPDISHYNAVTEMNDVLDGMAALGIGRAAIIGTSRGGIIAMLMGVARPGVIAGVVLNDVGPVIDARGLIRIKTYINQTPPPANWEDAVQIQSRLHGAQFPALSLDDWRSFVRMIYRDEGGRPVADFDPGVGRTLDTIDFDKPFRDMWNEFNALRPVPVLVIRGENSDLLSPETVARMQASHPRCEATTVPGEGHPPLLLHDPLIVRIADFVKRVEAGAKVAASA